MFLIYLSLFDQFLLLFPVNVPDILILRVGSAQRALFIHSYHELAVFAAHQVLTGYHVYLSLFIQADNTYPIIGVNDVILFNLILRYTKGFSKFLTFSFQLLLDIFLNLLFSSLVLFLHRFNVLPSNTLNQHSSFWDEFDQNLGFFIRYPFCSGQVLLPYSISFLKLSLINILLLALNYFFILLHVLLPIMLEHLKLLRLFLSGFLQHFSSFPFLLLNLFQLWMHFILNWRQHCDFFSNSINQCYQVLHNNYQFHMGILQSCQNGGTLDSRMSLSLDSSMLRGSLGQNKYGADDFYFQQSKLPLFGDIFYKKNGDRTEFVLQTHFTNKTSQVLSQSLKIYTDSGTFMHQKGSKIKIINPIDDPNYIGKQIFTIKSQGKPSQMILKTIPFNRYQDQKFKKGLYEVAMLHNNIFTENNRFGFVYQDAFVVQSGVDKDTNDKCLVIIGDTCNATLHELISYRKMSQTAWTQKQFEALCFQLIKGLADLHKNKICHRDVRPHNIYYSPQKRGFVIGNMCNSINMGKIGKNVGINLAGVPYYMPNYLYLIGKKQNYSQYYNYDAQQLDIYALGLTLLNALFLDQFLPSQVLERAAQKHALKYPFIGVIIEMLKENPPSLSNILSTMSSNNPNILDERNNIEAYRFKMKPQDEQFVSRKKTIARGYYEMFMYDEWVEEINEVVNYYELNHDNMQLAEIYKQIADIYAEHHQQDMMIEYYSRASAIFLDISNACMSENKNEQAIRYLERGIDCNRKGYRCQPNTDLAYLLNRLAMANHIKGEYEIARAFQQQALQIICKVNGDKSPEYAEMLVDGAKIQMQFQQFKQAETMLKGALSIIEKKQESKNNFTIKAKILESLGNTYRMKAMQKRDKCQMYRKKAEQCLLDSLDITQRNEGSIHPQIGSILMNLGNVYFDRKQFDKAKKSYEKSLVVKQHANKGRDTVQIGECLTYLANSQKCLREYDKSIKHYDEAIQVFRRAYGNDHNENTAVAIGNLGLVYKELGKGNQQREYLTLAKNILKDLYGQNCPDYQYFDRQLGN